MSHNLTNFSQNRFNRWSIFLWQVTLSKMFFNPETTSFSIFRSKFWSFMRKETIECLIGSGTHHLCWSFLVNCFQLGILELNWVIKIFDILSFISYESYDICQILANCEKRKSCILRGTHFNKFYFHFSGKQFLKFPDFLFCPFFGTWTFTNEVFKVWLA